jgi:hypothetical protein
VAVLTIDPITVSPVRAKPGQIIHFGWEIKNSSGALATPGSTPTHTATPFTPERAAYTTATAISADSTGVFHHDFVIPADATAGADWRLRIDVTDGGNSTWAEIAFGVEG